MSRTILFERIDEPGLDQIAIYERRGGYASLRKALTMDHEAVLHELQESGLRGRGGAGEHKGEQRGAEALCTKH